MAPNLMAHAAPFAAAANMPVQKHPAQAVREPPARRANQWRVPALRVA